MRKHPVIGRLFSDPFGEALASPFRRFDAGEIQGLAWVQGRRIDILAVASRESGRGHFKAFLARLKKSYREIGFHEIMELKLLQFLDEEHFKGNARFMVWRTS